MDLVSNPMENPLVFPVCRKECTVYDHLKERVRRDLDSVDFMTFIHASPPRIYCPEHGVI